MSVKPSPVHYGGRNGVHIGAPAKAVCEDEGEEGEEREPGEDDSPWRDQEAKIFYSDGDNRPGQQSEGNGRAALPPVERIFIVRA